VVGGGPGSPLRSIAFPPLVKTGAAAPVSMRRRPGQGQGPRPEWRSALIVTLARVSTPCGVPCAGITSHTTGRVGPRGRSATRRGYRGGAGMTSQATGLSRRQDGQPASVPPRAHGMTRTETPAEDRSRQDPRRGEAGRGAAEREVASADRAAHRRRLLPWALQSSRTAEC